jgi:hypothetical protein
LIENRAMLLRDERSCQAHCLDGRRYVSVAGSGDAQGSKSRRWLEPPYTDPYVRWCGRGGAARLPLSRSLTHTAHLSGQKKVCTRPEFVSPSDPAAQWNGLRRGQHALLTPITISSTSLAPDIPNARHFLYG